MTDFNFRVRAVDNIGAFADRDFTIRVRNTQTESVAYLTSTELMTSADGVNFIARNGANGSGITHGGGTWMVQAGETTNANFYRLSADGTVWETRQYLQNGISTTQPQTISRPFFLNNRFFVAYTISTGFPHIAISNDFGLNWTSAPVPLGNSQVIDAGAAFGNGSYVVFRNINFVRSNDLLNWSAISTTNTPIANAIQVNHLMFANGLFMMTDINNRLIMTPDFVNFTVRQLATPTNALIDRVYYGNGRLLVTLQRGSSTVAMDRVLTSDDGGITWTVRTFANFVPNANAIAARCTAAFANGGWYVGCSLVNVGAGGLRFSRDLTTWTTVGNTNHAVLSGGIARALL